jgi:hypothetical protein
LIGANALGVAVIVAGELHEKFPLKKQTPQWEEPVNRLMETVWRDKDYLCI